MNPPPSGYVKSSHDPPKDWDLALWVIICDTASRTFFMHSQRAILTLIACSILCCTKWWHVVSSICDSTAHAEKAQLFTMSVDIPTLHQRKNRRLLVSIDLWLCTHSYSPPLLSKVPRCKVSSFNVKRGPSSCSRAITRFDFSFCPGSRFSVASNIYLWCLHSITLDLTKQLQKRQEKERNVYAAEHHSKSLYP